jgi:signal transduction histidine kinase
MENLITETISSCEWNPTFFLIFSKNVFAPLIYYSHFGTLVVALFFGLFVFFNNKKDLSGKLLLYISLSLSVWMFSDLVLWATDKPKYTMFFWTLEIISEPLIYIFALRFFYTFINKNVIENLRIKIFSYILIIPTLILAPTKIGLTGYDLTNCDRAAIEGLLPKYGYFIEILIVFWIIFLAFNKFHKTTNSDQKKQILLTTIGICLFLFSFSLGNIAEVISENWYIGQIGYIGIPIFIAFLSYQIVKFQTFKIKIIGSQALVAATWFLILSLLLIRTIENIRVVVAATLALFSILAIFLVRSVKREVEQREKIQKLADDLQVANGKLRELDQLKSEFLSLATHQIRAPLTAIKGYSSMLLEGDFGVLPPKAASSVEIVMKSCQNLINIVNDFLNISRIEQGRMVYEKSIFDIGALVNEVANEIKPNIQNAGLDLQVNIKSAKQEVNADRNKIKQVIGNLIDNSIKYTVKGGISIAVFTEDNKVKVGIKDTGVGIDPQEMGKLFGKFSRTKDANKTNVIGTGLGLYIAKKMVEAHQGDIKVDSDGLGKGTTFTIELPKYS